MHRFRWIPRIRRTIANRIVVLGPLAAVVHQALVACVFERTDPLKPHDGGIVVVQIVEETSLDVSRCRQDGVLHQHTQAVQAGVEDPHLQHQRLSRCVNHIERALGMV